MRHQHQRAAESVLTGFLRTLGVRTGINSRVMRRKSTKVDSAFLKIFVSKRPLLVVFFILLSILACARPGEQEIIYVTATFPGGERVLHESPTPTEPTTTPIKPTPNPTRSESASVTITGGGSYTVQPGDTLAIIAASAGITLDALMNANGLTDPNLLEVGQVLLLPDSTGAIPQSPSLKLAPDSEIIYSPTAAGFNVASYVKLKEGFLRAYSDTVGEEDYLSGVEMVDQVAKNYSINPRILLALLEYRGKWLSEPTVDENQMLYPFGLLEPTRQGLYKQLLDTADILSGGYYGWKYRNLRLINFADGRSVLINPSLNPGTVALQYFLSFNNTLEQWQVDVSEQGFFQLYLSMFGDPFIGAFEPMIPADLTQPEWVFPFPKGETWYFTGGPHGGYDTGSAWASIDFAPPTPPDNIAIQGACYISPFWVTAVAPGVIARSGKGFIILDLDFDGNEHTGWTVVYLHIQEDGDLVQPGTTVTTGDRLGHPSCMGGFSSGTHLHIGRRYNGEWIPVDCTDCAEGAPNIPFKLSGWTVRGYSGAEYQGYMENADGDFRRAEVGREDPINQVNW